MGISRPGDVRGLESGRLGVLNWRWNRPHITRQPYARAREKPRSRAKPDRQRRGQGGNRGGQESRRVLDQARGTLCGQRPPSLALGAAPPHAHPLGLLTPGGWRHAVGWRRGMDAGSQKGCANLRCSGLRQCADVALDANGLRFELLQRGLENEAGKSCCHRASIPRERSGGLGFGCGC